MIPRYQRIHIAGAAGSGTTTLAAAVASKLDAKHLDVDDFAWVATDPAFTQRRDPAERSAVFRAATRGAPRWVLSGSLLRWGDELTPLFDLVVFLHIPPAVRIARLAARERARYGARIDPGGDLYESHQTFMALAGGYETGEAPVNTLANARAWLGRLTCPVIEIEGALPLAESVAAVLSA
jgi:adenylate kinase family enzyme